MDASTGGAVCGEGRRDVAREGGARRAKVYKARRRGGGCEQAGGQWAMEGSESDLVEALDEACLVAGTGDSYQGD